jgi:hypothetical protein
VRSFHSAAAVVDRGRGASRRLGVHPLGVSVHGVADRDVAQECHRPPLGVAEGEARERVLPPGPQHPVARHRHGLDDRAVVQHGAEAQHGRVAVRVDDGVRRPVARGEQSSGRAGRPGGQALALVAVVGEARARHMELGHPSEHPPAPVLERVDDDRERRLVLGPPGDVLEERLRHASPPLGCAA